MLGLWRSLRVSPSRNLRGSEISCSCVGEVVNSSQGVNRLKVELSLGNKVRLIELASS